MDNTNPLAGLTPEQIAAVSQVVRDQQAAEAQAKRAQATQNLKSVGNTAIKAPFRLLGAVGSVATRGLGIVTGKVVSGFKEGMGEASPVAVPAPAEVK